MVCFCGETIQGAARVVTDAHPPVALEGFA